MSDDAARIDDFPNWPIDRFAPALPAGRIDAIYTHWSAHDYVSVYPAYHFCVAQRPDGTIVVANTHDVAENMRDVTQMTTLPYAAHTRGRNSFAIGISMMAMLDAKPDDFGTCPLTEGLIDGLCRVGAFIAAFYGIAIEPAHVMSHAEAALLDGYFGAGDDQRWDIARLAAAPGPLAPHEATDVGDVLRARMRAVAPSPAPARSPSV